MNTYQTLLITRAKRLLIKALILVVFSIHFSQAYAQVCGTGQSLVAGQWTMIALPCAPTSNTVQDVFGDDLGNANYNVRWIVYERNESTDTYLPLSLSSLLNQGESYWILSLDAATVGVTGTATPLTTGNANCPSAAGCFEVMLTPPDINTATRQNMVGHPFPFDVDWADVVVEVDGTTTFTPSGADTAGFVSKTIHKYNGNGYDPFDDVTPAMEGVLNIYDGIWVETLGGSVGKTVKLLISDPMQPPVAQDDSYSFAADTNQNVAAPGLFNDNGSGADTLGVPAATLANFGGGSLGGAITDNAAGAVVALAGGSLQVNANGSWSLTGQPFTPGTYTFDYRLQNASGFSDATVTLIITPLASCTDDSYTATGNVGIDSTNGTNQSVLFNDTGTSSVTAFDAMSNNSTTTNVNVQPNGEFTYNPPAGFTGADSFTYTADGSLTCTVNITVSDRIWFIDNSGANGDGRLGSPFNSIANFNSTADSPGDTIFLDSGSGNYAGPLTLLNDQILIGEGATDTIANISGITFAPLSDTLPATSGTRPVIAHTTNNLTLGQGNTVRGLDVSNSGGTALNGNNFGNLTLSEVSVNNTAGAAINLGNGNPTASFTSVSASNSTNGIVLNNTTGSFTVTGDGTNAQNGSGGTIQNTTGVAVQLTSVNDISLSSMNFTGNGDTPTNGEHAIDADNLSGLNNLIRGSVFSGGNLASTDYINIQQSSGTLGNFTIDNSLFTGVTSSGNDAIFMRTTGASASATLTVLNNTHFQGIVGDGVQVTAENGGSSTVNISNSRFSNDSNIQPGGAGGAAASRLSMATGNGTLGSPSALNFTISSNTFNDTGVQAGALPVNTVGVVDIANNQVGSVMGTFSGNTIQNTEVDAGLRINADGTSQVLRLLIENNTLASVGDNGITIDIDDNPLDVDVTLRNNNIGAGPDNIAGNANDTPVSVLGGDGINLSIDRNSGGSTTADVSITNNQVTAANAPQALDVVIDADNLGGSNLLNLTLTGNTIVNQTDEAFDIEADDGGTICLNITGNSFTSVTNPPELDDESDGTFNVVGGVGNVSTNNTFNGVGLSTEGSFGTCTSPGAPTLP